MANSLSIVIGGFDRAWSLSLHRRGSFIEPARPGKAERGVWQRSLCCCGDFVRLRTLSPTFFFILIFFYFLCAIFLSTVEVAVVHELHSWSYRNFLDWEKRGMALLDKEAGDLGRGQGTRNQRVATPSVVATVYRASDWRYDAIKSRAPDQLLIVSEKCRRSVGCQHGLQSCQLSVCTRRVP
ncbi:hypothetical protein P170DRAFT_168030 [Aspergillus steynii IBT 23096]|uniref:Uncharacterized protein n=1 Tax=Aspergillus steynii IBT 23096 TaxID=1392250 RepID=A0A2I2G7I2_9EURO|nr:uncharacterized protein P170DRAFT_168030 [Aspergillus steynii IBT 23096]PLB48835.1 hypothetical protein P170DRAFT_168030 [Aspergillus steynii IBT 23096]